ncbi:hypothetical protein XYCOK13_28880 [Xylanibacillus composti]|uniref:Transposase n=2 Tax=Xylanibacillus composti TaxID=1572762 RepID=A0A8J4H397_9BACL|nr:hypothetical protein XYCOK13_28880 [Xylanibacillus composti]
MFKIRYKSFDQFSFIDHAMYSKLPRHPFYCSVKEMIDFSFADQICSVLYSERGQRPYAPSLKLKIHLVQAYENISDRNMENRIVGDLFIKRSLDLPADFFGFDHSTIGLDRDRMGEAMFQACHLYILAQLYSKHLWGETNERWIIDSFPAHINVRRCGAFRLIKRAMIQLVKHMKRTAPASVLSAAKSLQLDALRVRLHSESPVAEQMLAFSKLVTQAYGLLYWFQHENIVPLLKEWKNYERSQELQEILRRVLSENSRPHRPDPGPEDGRENEDTGADEQNTDGNAESLPPAETAVDVEQDGTTTAIHEEVKAELHAGQEETAEVVYEKTPRKQRPSDRIVRVDAPEVRTGVKNKSTPITGFKIQNMCTEDGVILNVRVVPSNEHDQDAMIEMVSEVQQFLGMAPQVMIGDTAYGHGKKREAMASRNITLVAPVAEPKNSTGKFDISLFTYDPQKDVFTCPQGAETVRKNRNRTLEGTQYFFDSKSCTRCALRTQCTTSEKKGRSVFRSDYAVTYEGAKKFNESVEGKETLAKRCVVERKNKELKNDCGLGRTHLKRRNTLQVKSFLAAIVVNLKHAIRVQTTPKPGVLRRAKMA